MKNQIITQMERFVVYSVALDIIDQASNLREQYGSDAAWIEKLRISATDLLEYIADIQERIDTGKDEE